MAGANEVGDSCLDRNSYGAAPSPRVYPGDCAAAEVGYIFVPTTLDNSHRRWSSSLQWCLINFVVYLVLPRDNFQNLPPLNVVLQTT